jgi:tetratricopeptide (TPR) repeat protein
MPEDNGQDTFQERVNSILDEISLGIRWERPSLIVAVYRSEYTRNEVQALLAKSLETSGHAVLHYLVDKSHYDIPNELLDYPKHEQVIFFINGLRWGGGRGYSNAYRALNMHREYLVEGCIKAIFWLSETEARQIARFSPDFWAFRHKVVEFLDLPTKGNTRLLESSKKTFRNQYTNKAIDLQQWIKSAEKFYTLGCMEEALINFQRALRKYPGEKAIHLGMAEIYLAMGQIPAASRSLKKAVMDISGQAHFLREHNRLNTIVKSLQSASGGILKRSI